MSTSYTKKCWFCQQATMVPDERGYRCSVCGTTWNELPKPQAYPVDMDEMGIVGHLGGQAERSASPSKAIQRQAARARASTSQDPRPE